MIRTMNIEDYDKIYDLWIGRHGPEYNGRFKAGE